MGRSNVELARDHAAELVARNLDAIIGNRTRVAVAILKEARTSPIVFVSVVDPIGSGLVSRFAHPGSNVTGFTNLEPSAQLHPDDRRRPIGRRDCSDGSTWTRPVVGAPLA